MKKIITILTMVIPLFAYADKSDLQNKQKIAQDFYTKVNAVMVNTDEAKESYRQGNPAMWKAINSDLNALINEADSEFGSELTSSFHGCFKLGTAARYLWTDKMMNSATLDITKSNYENAKRECKQNIINPQAKNDNVAIIDVTQ